MAGSMISCCWAVFARERLEMRVKTESKEERAVREGAPVGMMLEVLVVVLGGGGEEI